MKKEKMTFPDLEEVVEQLKSEKNEKQNLFQILFINNITINLIIDKETSTIVNANKAACNFYGYSLEEIVGMNLNQINILSEDEIKQEIAKTTDNQLYAYNFRQRLKNGKIRTVELYSKQIDFYNRKLLYFTIIDVTNQKQTEIALAGAKIKEEKSELFFKAICDQAADGIYIADLKGNITYVNQAYCNMFGYSKDELMKMNVQELKADIEKSVFKLTIEKDSSSFNTMKLQCKNKKIIYADVSTKIIDFQNQHLVLGIIRVVTEREEHFENIFNNLQDAYFEVDLNGNIVKTNAIFPIIYGYESVEEVFNMSSLNLYANENDRTDLISQMSNQGQLTDYIVQGKRKDGAAFWISMNVQYKYDKDRKIIGTVGVVRDIMDRKMQDEKIRESEEKYRNIYDNAIEGMFQTSIEGRCLQVNNAMAKMLGYNTAKEMVDNVYDPAHQTWLYDLDRATFSELMNKYGIVNGFESQFKTQDGKIIWVSIKAKLIRDENGNMLYYEGFIEDITDRKNKELEIHKKLKDLQWHFDIAMQRELKMVELKKEINELLLKLGQEEKYNT